MKGIIHNMLIFSILFVLISCDKSRDLKDFDLYLYYVNKSYRSNSAIALYTKDIIPIDSIKSMKSYKLNSNQIYSFERVLGLNLDNSIIILEGNNIVDLYSVINEQKSNLSKVTKMAKSDLLIVNKSIISSSSIMSNYNLNNYNLSEMSFYNKLLLFQRVPDDDSFNKLNIAMDSWNDSTVLYKELYTKEILDIFTYINQLSKRNNDLILLSDSVFDLGDVRYKEEVFRTVFFKNQSKYSMFIISAESTCNCSTVFYPKYPIKSNSLDSMKIVFKAITLGTNIKNVRLKFSANKSLNIKIKANVIR